MRIKTKNSAWRHKKESECEARGITVIQPEEVANIVYGYDDKRDGLLIASEYGEVIIRKRDILWLAKDLIELHKVFYTKHLE